MRRPGVLLLALLNPACVAAVYDGPRRPDADLSTIVPTQTRVMRIDDREVPSGSSLKVLPGKHSLVAFLDDSPYFSLDPLAVCFTAERGHTYHVRASLKLDRWAIVIVDEGNDRPIATRPANPYLPDCSVQPASPAPPLPIRRLALTPPTLLAGSEDGETETLPENSSPAPQESPPVPQVHDDEEPPAIKRAKRLGPFRPGTGLGLELGGAFGGTRLATATYDDGSTETMAAGNGFVSSLSGSWMPLWIRGAGFGGAVSGGIKFSQIGADENVLKLSRFPVTASVQTLLRLDQHWFLLARAGVLKELRIRLYGDGVVSDVDVTMKSNLGRQVEAGIYYAPAPDGAFALTARRAWLRYRGRGRGLDANSITIAGSVHLNF